MKAVVRAAGRLAVRLENALGVVGRGVHGIHADGSHQESILDYFAVVRGGHRVEPAEGGRSLQAHAAHAQHAAVFTALLNQVEALETDAELMEQARTVGMVEGTTYLYIRWDAA